MNEIKTKKGIFYKTIKCSCSCAHHESYQDICGYDIHVISTNNKEILEKIEGIQFYSKNTYFSDSEGNIIFDDDGPEIEKYNIEWWENEEEFLTIKI